VKKAAIVISERDNVATALEPLAAGHRLIVNGQEIVVCEAIDAGHKLAIVAIARGAAVIKYGSPIGVAAANIDQGAHVHTHNVASTRGRGDLASHVTGAAVPHGSAARLAEPPDS
jgi:hypothetical protein